MSDKPESWWKRLSDLTKLSFAFGVIAFLVGWGVAFASLSKPKSAGGLQDFVWDLQGVIFCSTVGALFFLAPLQIETLLLQHDAERERKTMKSEILQVRNELPICAEMNSTFRDAQTRKGRHDHLSELVDAFLIHHLGGLQIALKGDADFRFELARVGDDGSAIWQAFIKSARHSFFGVQYWYTANSLGAKHEGEQLEIQKRKAKDLARARAQEYRGTLARNDHYTRVFVIDEDTKATDKLYLAWLAMTAQSKVGITVRLIFKSKYLDLIGSSVESIGSRDFCIIDRSVRRNDSTLSADAAEPFPYLMAVQYEEKTGEPRKAGFEITHNPFRVIAAQTVIEALATKDPPASRLFGEMTYEELADLAAHERRSRSLISGRHSYPAVPSGRP